jgi:glycosyltransferase involved in cell wall biosynthesis
MAEEQRAGKFTAEAAPRVSVIMPAYNTASYIAESLDSVFAQTFHDYEVIVVNDGSPDTPQLETALRPYLNRIHYVKHENRGLSGARNTAIRHARGELLAFLDSDDIWLPGYLEAQVKFLDQNPRVVAAVADILRFGELVGQPSLRKMGKKGAGNTLTFEQMLRREGGQLPSATVVRRSRSIQAGLFDESLGDNEDIEFLYRLLFPDGLIGYLGQVLVKYRKHAASISGNWDDLTKTKNEFKILLLVAKKLPLTAAQRAILCREVTALEAEIALKDAYRLLANQEFDRAATCLQKANNFYHDPRIKLSTAGLKVFPRLTARILVWRWSRRSNPHASQ